MDIEILHPGAAPEYRAVMLRAFTDHPEAFTSTADERAALPLSWWQQRLATDRVFGARRDGVLVGVAGLARDDRARTRHRATLFGMYVAPEARGGGLGRRLVEAVLSTASADPGIALVRLTVTAGNDGAHALYSSCGFTVYGIEPWAIEVEGRYLDKICMWRPTPG